MANRWISSDQVRASLNALKKVHPYFGMTFLAFKKRGLPVGTQVRLNFSAVMTEFLKCYYKPSATYRGYYNPFITSNPSNRWVTEKYPSGALQRITVDTLGDAILHTKKESRWGWRDSYVETLTGFQTKTKSLPVPIFHLATWLYRDLPFHNSTDLTRTLLDEFHVTEREHGLFDFTPLETISTTDRKLTNRSLFRIIGWPPGEASGDSVTIRSLAIEEVGPALSLHYNPSKRLNVITGDNSLGKTFLLECAWWAITGHWNEYSAQPRRDAKRGSPCIKFSLSTPGHDKNFDFGYNLDKQSWEANRAKTKRSGGLAIYARHDGSYSVWDPTSLGTGREGSQNSQVLLDRESLWHGKHGTDEHGRRVSICNGLLSDWIDWQTRSSRFDEIFDAFSRCLEILSPPGDQKLEADEPALMPGDEQEIPALKMVYGTVPLVHASAGVQRVVGLVYAMIWTWFRHQRNAKLAARDPHDRLVLIVDEIEAHLHPRWQRSIVPALIRVVDILSGELTAQLHLASHSPLILASTEPIFQHDKDSLHHLDIKNRYATIKRLSFAKFGNVDSWLRSEIFALKHARSIQAEDTIERAKALQRLETPNPADVLETDRKLVQFLRDDDEFWPRWRYFAESISRKRS